MITAIYQNRSAAVVRVEIAVHVDAEATTTRRAMDWVERRLSSLYRRRRFDGTLRKVAEGEGLEPHATRRSLLTDTSSDHLRRAAAVVVSNQKNSTLFEASMLSLR